MNDDILYVILGFLEDVKICNLSLINHEWEDMIRRSPIWEDKNHETFHVHNITYEFYRENRNISLMNSKRMINSGDDVSKFPILHIPYIMKHIHRLGRNVKGFMKRYNILSPHVSLLNCHDIEMMKNIYEEDKI